MSLELWFFIYLSYISNQLFKSTGMSCETNINDCLSAPCHRGECIDGDNSFTCNCHPGYTGRVCQTQINECESNPCQFGGKISTAPNTIVHSTHSSLDSPMPVRWRTVLRYLPKASFYSFFSTVGHLTLRVSSK